MRLTKWLAAPLAAVALTVIAAQPGQAASGVKVGVLRCNVAGGIGFVFGSKRRLYCIFSPTRHRRVERYYGTIKRWGVDIGYIREGTMLWAVVAPTERMRRGALAGDYGGISASVAAGLGVGANALIGGFRRSVALQPLSVEGLRGLNLAAGITSLTLRRRRR